MKFHNRKSISKQTGVVRNPMKVCFPQAEKGKKMGAKLRFTRYIPEPEIEDLLLGYRQR